MEISRRWCFSGNKDTNSIQLGGGSSSNSTSHNSITTTSTTLAAGCFAVFTRTTTILREKWRRLMNDDRPRRRMFESSHVTCIAAEEITVLPCSYDRWSYEQNFDNGSMMWDDDEEIDNLSRSFSMRFARHPSGTSLFVQPRDEMATTTTAARGLFVK